MNDFEKEFILEHKLKPEIFYNANGSSINAEQKFQMKIEEKIFAYNTEPCIYGHTLQTGSGRCIVCKTSYIHFTLVHYNEGFVYIAGSVSAKRIKIGSTNNIDKREKYLNENKGYGNINDWKILYYVKSPKMGENEWKIQSFLKKYNEESIPYYKEKELKYAKEIYRCSYSKVFEVFNEHFGNNNYPTKQLVSDFDKYKFPNLAK